MASRRSTPLWCEKKPMILFMLLAIVKYVTIGNREEHLIFLITIWSLILSIRLYAIEKKVLFDRFRQNLSEWILWCMKIARINWIYFFVMRHREIEFLLKPSFRYSSDPVHLIKWKQQLFSQIFFNIVSLHFGYSSQKLFISKRSIVLHSNHNVILLFCLQLCLKNTPLVFGKKRVLFTATRQKTMTISSLEWELFV